MLPSATKPAHNPSGWGWVVADFFLWFQVFFWEYLAFAALLGLVFLVGGAGWRASLLWGLGLATLLPTSIFVGFRVLGV